MSSRNVYAPGNAGSSRNLHGTAAEQAAFVSEELSSVMMVGDGDALTAEAAGSQEYGSADMANELDPAHLYSLLEEAIPKQTESGRVLTVAEQAQKREMVEHVWDGVRQWLRQHPGTEERQAAAYIRGQADATPLHLMCKLHNPPEDVIQEFVQSAPEVVSWVDNHGWLPLHHACANGASTEIFQLLCDLYPEGKLHQDNQNRTPLHFYATRNSDNPATMAINAELLADTGAAELSDRGGMLPMHYACAYGTDPAVLQVLAHAYPGSLESKENKGRTPMHLAMVNAHRDASPSVIRFLLDNDLSTATVNTRDQDGYLPLHLLALGLRGYRAEDPVKRSNVSDCLSMYLDAEPVAAADFLTAIQDLPDWLQDTAVVSKHVRNVLNDKIIQRFPTSILMLDGYFLIIIIICFELTTRNHIDMKFVAEYNTTNEARIDMYPDRDPPGQYENHTQGALAILFVGAGYFLMRELVQILSLLSLGSMSSWWVDPANYLDMAVIFFALYYGVLMVHDNEPDYNSGISVEWFRSGVAFAKGLFWVAVIVYLKSTLVDFAVFVGGVFYVVQRLAAFLMAVGVILLAFAQMFYFIYVETDICKNDLFTGNNELNLDLVCRFPHCTFEESLLKVYTMMGEIQSWSRYSTDLTAQLLYVAYAFIVVILLSNVLIAIVTDSYEIIQNDRAAIVFWSNRLGFVAEMDAITYGTKMRIKSCFGKPKGAPGAVTEFHEGTDGPRNFSSDDEESKEPFREAWKQVMLLFDANLYEEIDWLEFMVYLLFRIFAIVFIIPLWLVLGLITAGWLWPPQIREFLFVQKETAASRSELERQKLAKLKGIQTDLKSLKQNLMREMANDRDEMIRLKAEVEASQIEVISDLQQVKELMGLLIAE